MRKNINVRQGFALPVLIAIIALLAVGGGTVYYFSQPTTPASNIIRGNESARETEPAVPDYEACVAKCRDQHGGSGSAGFDACVRACGANRGETVPDGGSSATFREEACPSPGPACPSPQIATCKNGKWVCIGLADPAGGGPATAGGIITQSGDTQSVGGAKNSTSFSGTVLAGSPEKAPLLDFQKADYDKAVASGKLVLLYFYADWCPICKAEFPKMQAAFNGLATDQVIGFRVNYKDDFTDADEVALAKQFGVAYQHTKVFVKNGAQLSKHPDGWNKQRYEEEISSRI